MTSPLRFLFNCFERIFFQHLPVLKTVWLPLSYTMLQHFEKISPLIESLWCALQDEVQIMGRRAGVGLWRHPRWPPFWALTWILRKIRNCLKRLKLESCDAGHVEYDIMKHLAAFCWYFLPFSPKKGKKPRIFLQKWLDHLLLMTSYLVTIATDFYWTCIKMCLRDMGTATVNGRSR